jgi:hypothetical protein
VPRPTSTTAATTLITSIRLLNASDLRSGISGARDSGQCVEAHPIAVDELSVAGTAAG